MTLSYKATLIQGALLGFLKPRMAVDSKLDWSALLSGITTKNYAAKKSKLLADIRMATQGKLGADASLDGLGQLLTALAVDPDARMAMDALEEEEEEEREPSADPEQTMTGINELGKARDLTEEGSQVDVLNTEGTTDEYGRLDAETISFIQKWLTQRGVSDSDQATLFEQLLAGEQLSTPAIDSGPPPSQ